MNPETKYAWVLQGGGFKGAYQLGVIRALLEAGVNPSYVAGISVGALNGSLVAQGKYDLLESLWERVIHNGYGEIWQSWLIKEVNGSLKLKIGGLLEILVKGKLKTLQGLGDVDPLRARLQESVRLADFQLPFRCGLASLTDGQYYAISPEDCPDTDTLVESILASATMPIIWKPQLGINTRQGDLTQLVDGGLQASNPLSETIDFINQQPEGETWKIIIIQCSGDAVEPNPIPYNLLGTIPRVLDMFLYKIHQADMKLFHLINQMVLDSGQDRVGRYRFIDHIVIKPGFIGSTLDSRPEMLRFRMNQGYKDGRKALQTTFTLS